MGEDTSNLKARKTLVVPIQSAGWWPAPSATGDPVDPKKRVLEGEIRIPATIASSTAVGRFALEVSPSSRRTTFV